ncbi:MAG: SDR family oxidoreductase [Anderseniella sp.]|jgi:NAD(P)-dependent dehydrogenase (short-subunit alcohol dehydrogenase family)|nr:SDR family oxidoreductase [Anderseniella sp.]
MSGKGTVLVTGASRGIGAACVRLLARDGHDVAINYARSADAAEALAQEVRAAGRKAVTIKADVGYEAEVIALFRSLDEALPPLTGLVNNAGILFSKARLDEMGETRINDTLRVNVTGSILCAREAIRRMSTRHGGNGGAIVNMSSAAARLGSPNEFIDYAASKGAIDAMTLGLSKEVAQEGIRVNAVRPGLIHTDIHASSGQPDRVERLQQFVPMGRGGSAEEVAEAVCWLMSDAASYVTGALVDVTGGR